MRGIVPQKDIRTEAIFASLNDCLYRQMNRFKFTLLVDFDEFVVLLKTKSLLEFTVDELKKADDPTRIGSLVFKNTFFYLQWADDPERMICGRRRFLPKALLLIVVFAIFFFFTTWLHLQFLGEIEESENPGSPSLIMKTAEEKALSPIVPTKGDPRKWMALRDGKIHFFGPTWNQEAITSSRSIMTFLKHTFFFVRGLLRRQSDSANSRCGHHEDIC